jgi:hypothetical protein
MPREVGVLERPFAQVRKYLCLAQRAHGAADAMIKAEMRIFYLLFQRQELAAG